MRIGQEMPDLEAVKVQAALALTEMAKDVLPGSIKRELSVEVRDERQPHIARGDDLRGGGPQAE